MKEIKKLQNKVEIYAPKRGSVDFRVKIEENTVWLAQKEIAELLGKSVKTINEHIGNIFKEGELEKVSTIRKFQVVQKEGKRDVKRIVEEYNLDVIISVGYRVKSVEGTRFRIWATKILRDFAVKGYVINEKRLQKAEGNLKELQETISFLQEKAGRKNLKDQSGEILGILSQYSRSLTLLEQFDKDSFPKIKGVKELFKIDYENARLVLDTVMLELAKKGEATDLFASEREDTFKGLIGNIYQTFGGKELYTSFEEKAAHLLYFVIKDHPFSDGNKRSGSFLFVYFLDKNNYLYKKSGEKKINDNALTALALLVAESDPKEKELMIKLIINLIVD